jgi:hypothetical protein
MIRNYWSNSKSRYQRLDLLLAQSFRHTRSSIRNATSALRHHQLHPARRCSDFALDNGSLRASPALAHRRRADVHLPPHYRRAGRKVRRSLGQLCHRGLGRRRILVLLHVQFWRYLGPSPVGNAIRSLPIVSSRKGRCVVDMLQLVQQLHHCKLGLSFSVLLRVTPNAISDMIRVLSHRLSSRTPAMVPTPFSLSSVFSPSFSRSSSSLRRPASRWRKWTRSSRTLIALRRRHVKRRS